MTLSLDDATATKASSNTSAPSPGAVTLPNRYQCPLCFDVLRRPILLPCCKRHLCMECFERALALTSVNCGFCRKRIVGFARKKQNKVDNALWNEILAKCPFLGAAMINANGSAANDFTWTIEFIDEQAPLRQPCQTDPQKLKPGELKQIYEQRVREHQSQLEHEEALALEKTMDFLQSDPEYLASLASQKATTSTESTTAIPALSSFRPRTGSGTKHLRASSPVGKVTAPPAKQQRLDTFFSSTATVDLTSNTTSMSPSLRASPVRSKNQSHIALPFQH
uniref:RING-type E3 ubiquitin transferase n=1 Tax=Globisporangium ultimum (strain ATCC 200006 / CBS 805.95 / DAOM BR144) TaxID=431595 RepID=K3WCI1_GLOUD